MNMDSSFRPLTFKDTIVALFMSFVSIGSTYYAITLFEDRRSAFSLHALIVCQLLSATILTATTLFVLVRTTAQKRQTWTSYVTRFIAVITTLILTVLCFAGAYIETGLIDTRTNEIVHNAGTAIYFSTVTYATIGFGDVIPTPEARPIVCIQALYAFVNLGVALLSITTLTQQLQEADNKKGQEANPGPSVN